MRIPALVAALAIASLAPLLPAGADLYWCTSGDTSRLTSEPVANAKCRLVDKNPKAKAADKPASKADKKLRPYSRDFPRVTAKVQKERDLTRRQILEYEMLEQRRKLEMVQQVLEGPQARRNARVAKEYSIRSNIHELNIIAIQQEIDRLD